MKSVATIIAEKLAQAGIDTIFGLPGGESVPLIAAFQTCGIEFVLVHNEASAVYMADANARLTGRPGVCLTTLGPGATNAMAGLGHAYLDRAPILFITARMWHEWADRHTHQTIDQTAIFAPVTKASFDLSPDNVAAAIDDALRLTMDGRPGPVHLQVSKQVAVLPAAEQMRAVTPSTLPPSDPDMVQLAQARQLIARAERPVVLVGLGLEPEQPYRLLTALVESLGAAAIVTPKGKGAISAESPHYAGTLGVTRNDPVYEILAEADCILAIGFDVVELVRPWDEATPLVWIAPWANTDVPIAAVAEIVGPMTPVLRQLCDLPPRDRTVWLARLAAFRAVQAARTYSAPQAGRLLPQTVLQAIAASVPDETLITTDVGSHKILAALEWPAKTPNRYMLSNGLSSMGFGLPAAIAGSLALGRCPVVSIMGDGGFSMVIGELELLTRLATPVIVVVMNDSALDLIRSAQRRAGEAAYGTEFGNPDFLLIAQAYGIAARRVTSAAACEAAVRWAVRENRPILIDAPIDPASYPTTPNL